MNSPASSRTIPKAHNALVLNSTRNPYDIALTQRSTPDANTGSVVIQVLATSVLSYANRVYTGQKPYPYPTPFVPGSSAIGRVALTGPDAVYLKSGQLVYFDCFIQGRDDENALILHGLYSGFDPRSNALMEGEWRDSTYAEYAKVPVENCHPLDETKLCGILSDGGLGYSIADLMYMGSISVPFGGLRAVQVQAGDRVIVAPATGHFGSAAVLAALAMGAHVIAVGRNLQALTELKKKIGNNKIRTVQITGDVSTDTREIAKYGSADVFMDISPVEAMNSTHFSSCIQALSRGGRISFMGAQTELKLSIGLMMHKDITIRCKWMYTKADVRAMIKLAELGILKLGNAGGVHTVGAYSLDQFEAAFEAAANMGGPLLQTILTPFPIS